MFVVLAVVFLVVPIVEIYVMVQVAGAIGVPETILLLIGISVVGAWLAKMAGIGVLNRLQRTVRAGKVPSAELVDGAPGAVRRRADDHARASSPTASRSCCSCRRRARSCAASCCGASGARGGSVPGDHHGPHRRPARRGDDDVWDVESWEDPPERPSLGR